MELGPLEYETLRIETGVPRFGKEFTGGFKDNNFENDKENNNNDKKAIVKANASPLNYTLITL